MRVTGAFLAEAASVVDGKLHVEGGFIRIYRVGIDRVVNLHLLVLAQYVAGDEAGNGSPKVTVEYVTPSGDSQAMHIDMPWAPERSADGEIGFAYWPLWLPAEDDGTYRLVVSGDEGSVSVPLTVTGCL